MMAGRLCTGLLLLALARPAVAQGTDTPDRTDSVLVPVATRALPRGTVLSEGDFSVARVASRGRPQTPSSLAPTGWIVRRAMRRGEVLRPPAVTPAPLVATGDSVTVLVDATGLSLQVRGRAIAGGALADTVAVRLGPKRVVQATITGHRQLTLVSPTGVPRRNP